LQAQSARGKTNSSLPPVVSQQPDDIHRLARAYGHFPLAFEANQGQTDNSVQFLARGPGFTLFLRPGEAVLSLRARQSDRKSEYSHQDQAGNLRNPAGWQPASVQASALSLKLIGANLSAKAAGAEPLQGHSNYLFGNDSAKWHVHVPAYSKVRYQDVYPGIDLVYYGNNDGQLEHDFIVAPGADPSAIVIALTSDQQVIPDADHGLKIQTTAGDLRLRRPTVYQDEGGKRKTIAAEYTLVGKNEVRFRINDYDKTRPLVIDPVLSHTSVIGGNDEDAVTGIAVDKYGEVFVTGFTASLNFPLKNPFQSSWTPVNPSSTAGFVAKINAAGTALLYSTYLGGPLTVVTSITLHSSGRAYIAGSTGPGFPLKNAYQSTFGGDMSDAFVAILSANGESLDYSTYLGGAKTDYVNALARDAAGNLYVTGRTDGGFPALHSMQPSGTPGVFVAKLNSSGVLQYSTLYGNDAGAATSIAVDSSGAAYIAGYSNKQNLPITAGAYRSTCPIPSCAFVAKINPSGASLGYSTYLGTNNAGAYGIVLDSDNNAYIGGTTSSGFPVSSTAFQKTFGGGFTDAFVSKLNPTGTALIWSTYLGGNGDDYLYGLALDSNRTVYASGDSCSSNFPLKAQIQNWVATTSDRPCQLFVTTLSGSLSSIQYYSTYLGSGTFSNQENIVAVDQKFNVYLAGYDTGNIKATKGALSSGTATPGADFDVFVSKLDIVADLALALSASPSPVPSGANLTYTITVTNKGPDFATNVLVTDSVPGGATFVSVDSAGAPCHKPQVGGLGVINCFLPQLNKGATWTVKMTVKVNVAAGITLEDSAATNSNMQDFNINNGIGIVDTKVQ
jgi:uncharacterized repeat protein (TIGR01451 family)